MTRESNSADVWTSTDTYLQDLLLGKDPVQAETLTASAIGGLPDIAVSPLQGAMLELLARATGARRILEIGTLGGYSTVWLARALPSDGELVTCEFDPHHAAVARANISAAGFADRVTVVVGPASQTLAAMDADTPFDIVFIDANKDDYPSYLEQALRLTRSGSLIIADNVVRQGQIADPTITNPFVVGARHYLEGLAARPQLRSTVLQTVGVKGHDGFSITLVP